MNLSIGIASPHTQRYLDTPAKWTVFPGIHYCPSARTLTGDQRVDELLAGQQREVTSARRAFLRSRSGRHRIAGDQFSPVASAQNARH